MDFTISIYKNLLKSLQSAGFFFKTFSEYITENPTTFAEDSPLTSHRSPLIILRHDVDILPQNSLRFAQIQAEMGIKGSYYFRAVPESWDEKIIKEIASLGHEVGYHYENMDTVSQKSEGLSNKSEIRNQKLEVDKKIQEYDKIIDLAYEDFCENIEKLRKLVPVSTICMHGSPMSKFDNKAIWDKYDYKALLIIGEPYYDMNFDEVFYLTDTGRRWDGWKVSVRDKVPQQELWNKQGLTFHSTQDIIDMINEGRTLSGVEAPNHVMFTMHPQRWHDAPIPWTKELVMQNVKNIVKKVLYVKK